MFEEVVLPLRANRSIDVTIDAADSTNNDAYFPLRLDFEDVDVILLEGIFLFKRGLRAPLDASVWIDCSFERAVAS